MGFFGRASSASSSSFLSHFPCDTPLLSRKFPIITPFLFALMQRGLSIPAGFLTNKKVSHDRGN